MRNKRKHIPKILKDTVKHRQKNKCVCCEKRIYSYHHVLAVALFKEENYHRYINVVGLCEEHHKYFHLGDPDTFQAIYEYAWYLCYNKIPSNKDIIEISNEVLEAIKKV